MADKLDWAEIRGRALLSIQRALLGAVTENLRGVTVGLDGRVILVAFVYDGEVTEREKEIVSAVETEVIADFFPERTVKSSAVGSPEPSNLEQFLLEEWVFRRLE